MTSDEYITACDIQRHWMLRGLRNFTECAFAEVHKTPFVFGRHHEAICGILDKVVAGELRKVIINIAPRYGKTELVSKMFIAEGFAINPKCRFIHLSYSSSLAVDNSMAVKDILNSDMFRSLFSARVRRGRDTMAKWDTAQGGGLYATSTLGQITGFGAGATDAESGDVNDEYLDEYTAGYNPHKFTGAIVIDDPIRPEDALSDVIRERVNRRFETTIRNRVNSRRTPIIIICQRTHERDLCGYVQDVEPGEWTVLSMPCLTFGEDGKEIALWPHKHTVEELHRLREINAFVFETQYMQNPRPLEGLMYERFRTYDAFPLDRGTYVTKNYTDSADTGSDYLCSIDYREYSTGEIYVLSVLYTNKPMEYTEVRMAEQLTEDNVDQANIEGNNGGRGFARNVERNIRALGNRHTAVSTFTQSLNKSVRIFTHSATVQNMVYFPSDWARRWPQFHNALTSYRKEGRNAHDDAPDAVTGMVEKRDGRQTTRFRNTRYDAD